MIPSLLPLIAPPVRTWVRGPLGRRPTVADRAPCAYLGTRASGPPVQWSARTYQEAHQRPIIASYPRPPLAGGLQGAYRGRGCRCWNALLFVHTG